jgi:membrane-associated phospholipid phosphatase
MKYLYTTTLPIGIVLLTLWCSIAQAQNIDINMLRNVNLNRNKALDPTFEFVTNTAAPISIAAPIVVYGIGLLKKDSSLKKQGIFIGESFLVAAFVTTALKRVIKRQRPFITYPEIENTTQGGTYSFPSGHTSDAFATATSLSIAFPHWYVIAPSAVWASGVAYSRMHLGVHYPSDVLAGAIVGSGASFFTYKANKWLNKKRHSNYETK